MLFRSVLYASSKKLQRNRKMIAANGTIDTPMKKTFLIQIAEKVFISKVAELVKMVSNTVHIAEG